MKAVGNKCSVLSSSYETLSWFAAKAGMREEHTASRFDMQKTALRFRYEIMQLLLSYSFMVAACHDVLVQPRVTSQACHVGPDWSFSGRRRLVVKLDPKAVAACDHEKAGTEPSYVSFIKDSWKPSTPLETNTPRRTTCSVLQFW